MYAGSSDNNLIHNAPHILKEQEDKLYLYSLKKMTKHNAAEVMVSLTGLRTRKTFYFDAGELLENNTDRKYAVIYFDIYRFMTVNDFCGREQGDALLVFISECFKEYEGEWSIASHFRADIFALLTPYKEKQDLINIVTDIYNKISSYRLSCKVFPSFGICMAEGIKSLSILCDNAKLALETIKGKVFNFYAFYNPVYRMNLLSEKSIENKMESALHNGEFVVYLQPKVNIETERIIGGEALVRWIEAGGNIVEPMNFVPVFEKDGFIIQLDTFMWREVFKILRRWKDQGLKLIPISVNVSRMHTYNKEFLPTLCQLTKEYNISPKYVRLELTESAFLEDPEIMFDNMRKLRQKGFLFSMDDYGSGYSTMKMLISQPVDEIKIDKVFLDDINNKKSRTILKHTTGMIRDLKTNMIAEGVETKEQAEYLHKCGCNKAQGFYYYRPMPVEEFEKIVYGATVSASSNNLLQKV